MPAEEKLAAAVAAAGGTPEQERAQQQRPLEAERDEEQRCDPRKGRPPPPYAATTAASSTDGIDATGARTSDYSTAGSAATAGHGPPSGRAFAWAAHGPAPASPALVVSGGGNARASGERLVVHTDLQDAELEGDEEDEMAPCRYGYDADVRPTTVALWNVAESGTGVLGAAGQGGRGREVGGLKGGAGDGLPPVVEVGGPMSVVDVSSNGDDGRPWVARGEEAV